MWPFNRTTKRVQELQAQVREYELRVLDAITYSQIVLSSDSNQYATKKEAVKEIVRKYEGEADYGNQLVKRIINRKVADVLPNGLQLAVDDDVDPDDAAPELEWLGELLDYNDLDMEGSQDLEKEAQFEGQVLVWCEWIPADQQVRVHHVPWRETEYELTAEKDAVGRDDWRRIKNATWRDGSANRQITLDGAIVAYVCFNAGSKLDGNPCLRNVLTECEELDKALRDWHKISQLFAKQTPYFETEDEAQAEEIRAHIVANKWKVGSAFASPAKFGLHGPTGITVEILREQILTLAKIISGATGVPVHHLGFPDLMSNRSTAESMDDPVEIESSTQQSRWVGFYEDLLAKSIALRNANLNSQLRPDVVKPHVEGSSTTHLKQVEKVWLPAAEKSLISKRLFVQQLPDVDVEAELDEQQAEADERAATAPALPTITEDPQPTTAQVQETEDDDWYRKQLAERFGDSKSVPPTATFAR